MCKNWLKIPNRLEKKSENRRGGFFTHTVGYVSLRYAEKSFSLTGRTLEEHRTQLSADSVDSLLFIRSAFDDKYYTWSS